jgi:hypothetical protein
LCKIQLTNACCAAAIRRYGKIGYGFGRGSYNISAQQYADAVAAVVSAPLASIAADFGALLRQEPMAALLQHYSAAGERHCYDCCRQQA